MGKRMGKRKSEKGVSLCLSCGKAPRNRGRRTVNYANVSNAFWIKERGEEDIRTYASSEPRAMGTHRRTQFLPFHRDVPFDYIVSSRFHLGVARRKRAR